MITITDLKGSSYARDVSEAKKLFEKEEVEVKGNTNLLPNTAEQTVAPKYKTELKVYPKRNRLPVVRNNNLIERG